MLFSNLFVSSKLATRFGVTLLSTCVAFAASTSGAQAALFTASGAANSISVAASANFTVSGNTLTVALSNTGTGTINSAGEVLTAVFFNIAGSPLTLTPGSALLGTSSTVTPGGTAPTAGNVGGEWGYGANLIASNPLNPAPAFYGISSSGLSDASGNNGIFGQPNFNGSNLQNPQALDGINYGIANSTYVNGQGNGSINSTPLIRNAVTFTLNGLPTGFNANSITGVRFQYGTSSAETRLVGTSADVPEPSSALGMLFLGSMGGAAALKRKKNLAR
jgi:PEP-CTERM motif